MTGEDIRQTVFRDTRTYYQQAGAGVPAPRLLRFARQHAGPRILDLGCATGNYSLALATLGYRVSGADVNANYVRIARERGVDAHLVTDRLPFPDGTFDTVILFETLEHVLDPGAVLDEARRVTRGNLLLTVPNSSSVAGLQREGLIYEHFADLDHRQFFTAESMGRLLQARFREVQIRLGDPLNPLALVRCRALRFMARAGMKLGLVRPLYHFRIYAVATI